MSAPSRIEHVNIHQVYDHAADESYQVELLRLQDGSQLAYRVVPDETGGYTFVPAEAWLVATLAQNA
ncbi:hypothetical protein AWB92_19100 [Mycobacterium sp. IEC1808]|uniref:hypothetical protein n=1 Tax=Mycobacterium sp. IEC1808 TaxID=1743230 RepID=UPI000A15BEB5|nr:hypothetical protein [Mycobacterium sp. IEC1808]ORW91286.1 hypothetical protein AWB92_19100 [Mycobacterium sp. IEC1808]